MTTPVEATQAHPLYLSLTWEEMTAASMRAEGYTAVAIAQKLHVPNAQGTVFLNRAVRGLGYGSTLEACGALGWPLIPALKLELPPQQLKGPHATLKPRMQVGDVVQITTWGVKGKGTVKAMSREMVLVDFGKGEPRECRLKWIDERV